MKTEMTFDTTKIVTAVFGLAVLIALAFASPAMSEDGNGGVDNRGGSDCDAYIQGELKCSELKYGVPGVIFDEGPYDPETHEIPTKG